MRQQRKSKSFAAILEVVVFVVCILSFCLLAVSANGGSQFTQIVPSQNPLVPYQSLVHEGDLIVSGNDTHTIENSEYDIIGNIVVEDDATLIIRNAVLNQTGTYIPADVPGVNIMVKNRASIILTNSTLLISQGINEADDNTSRILVQDTAKMQIAGSKLESLKYDIAIWTMGQSSIYIENTIMKRPHKYPLESCTLVINDFSDVHVSNLTFDRAAVYGSSRVSIERSTLGNAVRVFDNPTIWVSDSTMAYVTADESSTSLLIRSSTIESYIRVGGTADVWLIRTTVQQVLASDSSKVSLIDTSVGAFLEEDSAIVLMGWDLPFFGPVAFYHTLVPIVNLAALNLIVITAILGSFFVMKKMQKPHSIRTSAEKNTKS